MVFWDYNIFKNMHNLIKRDLKHILHPCSQMKDYEDFAPLIVEQAYGPYLKLVDGQLVIDAIASWWCKSLGHNHPRLKEALIKQAEKFSHVILANTTNETIVSLSEKLTSLAKTLTKVCYASDGSCAIEIAAKMSLHSRKITGEQQRDRFMALENSYHGETGIALSLSDLGLYREPYQKILLPNITFLKNIPYVNNSTHPLWKDCSSVWPIIEQQLNAHATDLTAIIVEPIVQGAGGMLIYSQDFLQRLRAWTLANKVHLIADEIMTGIGRTGLPLACQHAAIEPDFLCLGKGLTSGWLPLSVVLFTDKIYNLFYADYQQGKNFLHSHTHTGNTLAASVALECLKIMDDENIYAHVQTNENHLCTLMEDVAEATGKIENIRHLGAVVAADLKVDKSQRAGYAVYRQAVKLGALLRPLGNTIYWLPPLNIEHKVLNDLRDITIAAINQVL